MKKARKPLAVLLAACMLFGSAPASVFASDYDETVDATFDTQETVEETSNVQEDMSVTEQETYDQAAAEEAARLEQEQQEAEAVRIAEENQQAMQEAADRQAAEEAALQAEAAQTQQEAQNQADQETSVAVMGGVDASNSTDDTAVTDTTEETQNPEEDGSEEETHPAFSFYDIMLPDGTVLDIDVPAGAIFAGTSLMARTIDLGEGSADPGRAADILSRLSRACGLTDGEMLSAGQVKAYEIFFYDGAVGEVPHIRPDKGVTFTLRNLQIEGDTLDVYAIPEITAENPDPAANKISNAPAANSAEGPAAVTVTDNTQFNVIAVVGNVKSEEVKDTETTNTEKDTEEDTEKDTEEDTEEVVLAEQTLTETVDGKQITVSGNLPEGAVLQVVPIPAEEAKEMAYAYSGANEEAADKEILFAYDLSILADGKVFQPEEFGESVTVMIANVASDNDEQDAIDVLHVKADVADNEGNLDRAALDAVLAGGASSETLASAAEGDAVFFDIDSFSILIGLAKAASDGSSDSRSGQIGNVKYTWDIKWNNAADVNNISYEDDGTLLFHPLNWTYVTAHMDITLDVDPIEQGSTIPVGAIQFRLPASVFKGWNGDPADIMSTQLTTSPETATQSVFIYSIDDETGDIIVTNFDELGSVSFKAEFSWRVNPLDVNGGYPREENKDVSSNTSWWNNYVDYFQNTVNPAFLVDTDGDGSMDETTYLELKLAMMTRAGGQAYIWPMTDTNNGVYFAWQDSWGETPEDAEDYFYIVWNANYGVFSNHRSSQPWIVTISAEPGDNTITIDDEEYTGGSLVGVKRSRVNDYSQPYFSNKKQYNYYTQGTDGNGNDKTYNAIASSNVVESRFAQSKFQEELYTAESTGYKARISGWTYNGSDASTSDGCGVHYAVLMKYPWDIIRKAEEAGIDMSEEGLNITSKMVFTETWDSGYQKTVKVESEGAPINIYEGGGGTFSKLAGGSILWNSNNKRYIGGGTLLAQGPYVDLNMASSENGSYTPSWVLSYNGDSPTAGDKILGQHAVITDTELSVSQCTNSSSMPQRKWDPSVSYKKNHLDDEDYWIRGFWITNFSEYDGKYTGGAWQPDNTPVAATRESYKPIYIYVRLNGSTDFIPYAAVYKEGSALTYYEWDGTNEGAVIQKAWGHYALPEGTVQLRAEHDSEHLRSMFNINIGVRLYSTDDLKLIANQNESVYVKNAATCEAYPLFGKTDTPYITLTNRGADSDDASTSIFRLSGMSRSTEIVKSTSVPPNSDAAQKAAGEASKEIAYVGLRAYNTASIDPALVRTTDYEEPYKLLEGTFYELLPKGTTVQPGSIFGFYDQYSSTTSGYGASSYPTLKNAGNTDRRYRIAQSEFDYYTYLDEETNQTMLVINYAIPDPHLADPSDGYSGFYSHTEFYFILENTYENIVTHGTSTINAVAFENRTKDGWAGPKAGNRYTDAGLEDKAPAFTEIYENNNNAVFTVTTIPWNAVTVQEAEIKKSVKAEETKYSLPITKAYVGEDTVTVGNRYTYRLRMTLSSDTKASNIIMYDILEGGTDELTSGWKGTFAGIDTSLISSKITDGGTATCVPVVYYSTKINEVNSTTGTYFDLETDSRWTTDVPDDPSLVTAIAIDCRKASNGTDFILGNEQSIYAFITMDAPETLPEPFIDDAINGVVTFYDMFQAEPSGTIQKKLNNTVVHLRDVDISIEKASVPETGTEDEPRWVAGNGTGSIDYDLTVKNNGEYDYRNVVVEDIVPEGLTVTGITVELNGAEERDIAALGGIVYTVDEDGKYTFTIMQQHPGEDKATVIHIHTTVDALENPGKVVYENTSRITSVNDVELEEPIVSETTYHQAESVQVDVVKKWVDGDDQDGVRPESITVNLLADGKPALDKNGKAITAQITEDEDGKWGCSFKALEKYLLTEEEDGSLTAGDAIEYSVEEVAIDGYATTYDPENQVAVIDETTGIGKVSITNTHEPETIDITVTKTWSDAENQDGVRPERIVINLRGTIAAAEEGGEPQTVVEQSETVTEDEDGNWGCVFEDLPRYINHGKEVSYEVTEDAIPGYVTEIGDLEAVKDADDKLTGYSTEITNTYIPKTLRIVVTKEWEDEENRDGIRPEEITFNLTGTVMVKGEDDTNTEQSVTLPEGQEAEVTVKEDEDGNWGYTWNNLPAYQAGSLISWNVTEKAIEGYTTRIELEQEESEDAETGLKWYSLYTYTVTNVHEPELIDIPVTKVWEDNDDQDGIRPETILITLKGDGKEIATAAVSALDNWSHVFTGLPVYAEGEVGREIVYDVTENALAGYETTVESVSEDVTDGFIVTNTHEPETVDIPVQKVWDDNDDQDGKRPDSVVFRLLADGHVVKGDEEETDPEEPGTDEGGNTGTDEGNDEEGGEASGPQDADWDKVYKAVLTEENQEEANKNVWTYVYKDMPIYDHGHVIRYTLTEDVPEDYVPEVHGYTIINKYAPGKTAVIVTKAWDDENDRNGMRPKEVMVDLLADGAIKETVTLTEGNGWTYCWNNLNKMAGGKKINYTVQEHGVKVGEEYGNTGYTLKSIEETAEGSNSWIITNSYEPETVNVTANKIWDDNDDENGVRPDEVTVRLLANEIFREKAVLSEDNNWSVTWNDLPRYDKGSEIRYTVTEDAISGYTVNVSQDADENGLVFNITNKHTPGKTFVSVIKVWSDNANANKTRPESITVRLYADGKEIAHQTLSSQTGWFHVFTDLDTKNGGKEIAYTITEDDVAGYESVITGSASEGYMINNKLIETPEKPEDKEKEKETEKEKEKETQKETEKESSSNKSTTTTGGGPGGGAPGGGDGGKIAPVKTGDDTPIGLYVTMLVIGLAALTGVILAVRKRRRS